MFTRSILCAFSLIISGILSSSAQAASTYKNLCHDNWQGMTLTQNGDGSTSFSTIDFGYYGIAIPDSVELEILANGVSLDRIDITANFEEKVFRGVILRSFYYEAVDFFNYGDAIGFRVHVSRGEERQTYPENDWYEASVLFGTCL